MTEDTKHFLYKALVTVQIAGLVIATALVILSFISWGNSGLDMACCSLRSYWAYWVTWVGLRDLLRFFRVFFWFTFTRSSFSELAVIWKDLSQHLVEVPFNFFL